MLRQCATTAITAVHAASTMFAMAAMLGRLVAQFKMPRLDAYDVLGEVHLLVDFHRVKKRVQSVPKVLDVRHLHKVAPNEAFGLAPRGVSR